MPRDMHSRDLPRLPRLAERSAAGEILPDGRTEPGIFTRNLSNPNKSTRLVKVPGTPMQSFLRAKSSIPVNSVGTFKEPVSSFFPFDLYPKVLILSLVAIVSCRSGCVVGA
jgi:hypothetical protein